MAEENPHRDSLVDVIYGLRLAVEQLEARVAALQAKDGPEIANIKRTNRTRIPMPIVRNVKGICS